MPPSHVYRRKDHLHAREQAHSELPKSARENPLNPDTGRRRIPGCGRFGCGCAGGLIGFAVGAGLTYAAAPKGYNGMGNSMGSAAYWLVIICGVGLVTGLIGAFVAAATSWAGE